MVGQSSGVAEVAVEGLQRRCSLHRRVNDHRHFVGGNLVGDQVAFSRKAQNRLELEFLRQTQRREKVVCPVGAEDHRHLAFERQLQRLEFEVRGGLSFVGGCTPLLGVGLGRGEGGANQVGSAHPRRRQLAGIGRFGNLTEVDEDAGGKLEGHLLGGACRRCGRCQSGPR